MRIIKFKYKSINSTNDTSINLIKKKNIKFGYVITENQKNGKGQRGKRWISYKGNLFISIFFSLEKINLTLKQLTKINAKLIIKLISRYCKNKIKLKFPNDILINQKKVCGILQETIVKNGTRYIIVGIGINLIKSPNIKDYPTTNLYELTKTKINTNKITNELLFIYKNFLKSQKVY